MAVYPYHTGVVDTTQGGESPTSTPSRQQAAITTLRDDNGNVVAPPTAYVSPHNPVGTNKGVSGANNLNGTGTK